VPAGLERRRGREHHDRPFIEDDLQLEPEVTDLSRTIFSFGSQVATMLRPTESGRDMASPRFFDEEGRGLAAQRDFLPVAGSTSKAP
jgi:hypothetical protein